MVGKADVQKATEATSWSPVQFLSGLGVRSGHAYTAGFASIGLSVGAWLISRGASESTSRADRWGVFVGEWAPTFFALGVALSLEEDQD